MSDEKLPAIRPSSNAGQPVAPVSTALAQQTRNPISGFFHSIGSKTATRALDNNTAEVQARTRNLDAHTDGVHAIMRLGVTGTGYALHNW